MAVILNNSGVLFDSGNSLDNAPGGMGGATWHTVTASRSKNVTYTNNTGRQLWVNITATATGSNPPITVEGYTIFTCNGTPYVQSFLFCVNKGSQYAWATTAGTIMVWAELYI
jgi:hypothetical protein